MKKIFMCALCCLLLIGCSGGKTTEEKLDDTINNIKTDFDTTIKGLTDSAAKFENDTGDNYETYLKNKESIFEWLDKYSKKSDELFDRTIENSNEYFELTSKLDSNDIDKIEEKMNNYSDTIDEVFEKYEKEVYSGSLYNIFTKYYDIITKSYDTVDYDELSKEAKEFYKKFTDAMNNLHKNYSDTMTEIYKVYGDVYNKFSNKEPE